jgi:hypothetical protein
MSGWSISCDAQENQTKPAPTSSTDAKDNSKSEVDSSPADPQANSYDTSLGPHLLKDFAYDQKAIWTSPVHLRLVDADWFLPLGIVAGGMLATDTETSKHLSNSPNRIKYGKDLSNYGLASMVAAGGGLYLWGHITHDDHKREAGLLAGEAAVHSLTATYALKYAFGRERPLQDNYQGKFWQGGDSFPSEHAAAAWSIASVIAHEYPSPYVKLLAYGLAAAVSASRVDAKQHFPSDVLIGSAIGWFVGEEVYRRHHDPEVGGGDWETYAESHDESPARNRTRSGSPYVQLDSWIYPAIERLAALGYIRSEFLGMRPWTRIECAHLVEEAGDQLASEGDSDSEGASQLYYSLQNEFQGDLDALGDGHETAIRLESLYSGTTGINGKPLNDSYHFGQTIINNYGRPYQEGLNNYDGFSGYGTAGRFTLYVRGEYQHAPFAPAYYSLAAREAIATDDRNPLQSPSPTATVNQFTLLDTYLGANVAGWDFTFGKQSLWWGPGEGGPLMFSDNAEPIYMFRGSRRSPLDVPLVSRLLGPMKVDFFVGKLSGDEFPPRPAMHGEKVSFKPTPNLEFGFSRTVEFGGVGRPMTIGAILNSYVSVTSSTNYSASKNPGKRSSGVDVSYKVPFMRNWLSIYADSFAADDVTPLANLPRAAWISGWYMPRLPGIPKLDLRVEAGYTDTPGTDPAHSINGEFVYYDYFYHDLYTNKGNILGSWMGREGKGVQIWTTYWFNPRSSFQFGYREAKVAKDFIPTGETVSDGSVKFEWLLRNDLSLSGFVQYEKWLAPILAPTAQTNFTSTVKVTFYPHSWSW